MTAICPLAVGALVLFGCSKGSNNSFETYGSVEALTATFTVTPIPGNDAKYVITNTTQGNCVGTKWDLGKDTSGGTMGKTIDTAFFPLPGTYSITMYAMDKRGKFYKAATPVSVTTTLRDPAYENLIRGGKMNTGDEQYWNIFNANPNNKVNWVINNNAFNASISVTPVPQTSTPNGGIYQAVQVVANKKYRFSMNASYDAPNVAWLEVWAGSKEPASGADYNMDGGNNKSRLSFITWNNWVGFTGSKSVDIVFGVTGTNYVVIKAGCNGTGSFGNSGFNVSNVELRRIQE